MINGRFIAYLPKGKDLVYHRAIVLTGWLMDRVSGLESQQINYFLFLLSYF
jgi:hypothetical protein